VKYFLRKSFIKLKI